MSAARLLPGTPLRYWRVSDIAEARYDLPDEPMQGGMDSAFFLTRDRNFIPHEYPCRTRFAADHRGRRPEVRGEPAFTRAWLPFGAPAPRPLRASGSARPASPPGPRPPSRPTPPARPASASPPAAAPSSSSTAPRPATSPPTPATRKRAPTSPPPLPAGRRHPRGLLRRPRRARHPLPLPARLAGRPLRPPGAARSTRPPRRWPRSKPRSRRMHFDRPAYAGGEVALVLPRPLPRRADLAITARASTPALRAHDLAPGAGRRSRSPPPSAPPTSAASASRSSSTASPPPGRLGARDRPRRRRPRPDPRRPHRRGAGDGRRAGRARHRHRARPPRHRRRRPGDRGDARRRPRPDRRLLGLRRLRAGAAALGARSATPPPLPDALRARIDRTVLGYRYWLDEPGNDVQWYFSENHALLFHTAAYLAGHLLPDARFVRSGRTGAEQSATGRDRVRGWLDHFERWEMAEFNSAPYFPIDLKGLTALFALAPDADIRARAGRGIARLARDRRQLRPPRHPDRRAGPLLRALAARRLRRSSSPPSPACSGAAAASAPASTPCRSSRSACATTACALPDLAARALWHGAGAQEWCFRQGEDGFAAALPLQDPRLRARLRRALPLVRVGLPGDPGPRPHRHRAAGADLDQPPRRADPGRLRPPLLLGRQRLDPAGPAVPRPRRRRLRRHGAAARLHPRLVPARRLRRKRASTATAAFARSGDGLAALLADGPLEADRRPARAPAASSAAPAAAAAGSSASATRGDLAAFRAPLRRPRARGRARRPHDR